MDYWHFNFICPYFIWDEKQRIGCEGKHILKFDTGNDARRYMKEYCAGWKWHKCPHADQMNKFYEESKENGKSQKRKGRTQSPDK